jgi:parallel beta-helix repeat protein
MASNVTVAVDPGVRVEMMGTWTVPTNAVLTFGAGARVEMLGNYKLDIFGTIQALGASKNPVTVTSGRTAQNAGDWDRIQFEDSSIDSSCLLSNVVVEYATYGVVCSSASPKLSGAWIRNCSQDGINLDQSSPLVQGGIVESNAGRGIYCQNKSSPQILGNTIRNNGSDGVRLYCSTSTDQNCWPVIGGNALYGNRSGYEMQAYNYYQPANAVINARSNWWGTADPLVIAARIWDYADRASDSPFVDYGNWLGAQGGTPAAGRFVTGAIANNTVWRAADSPIGVIGLVTVLSNVVLSVDPGVQIKAFGNYQLNVVGTLQALGQPTNQIVFSSGQPLPIAGDWQGIKFVGSGANSSVLSNVVVEYAQTGVWCQNASPTIVNSHIQRQSTSGIYLDTSSPTIASNLIEFNATGIYCYQSSSPLIQANTIVLNRNDGVHLQSSTTTQDLNPRPVLFSNSIFTNSTAGSGWYNLAAVTYYQPGTNTINAVSNWWGTTDPARIEQTIYHDVDNAGSPHVNYGQYLTSNPNFTPYGVQHSLFWFSPNGDGIRDTVIIQGFITHTSKWATVIIDSSGAMARSFSGTGVTISNVWDGALQGGGPAPEGLYRSMVLATNLSDTRQAPAYGDFSYIDRTAPLTVGALNTLPDGTIANQLLVQGSVSGSLYTGYVVDYGVGLNPTSFITIVTNSSTIFSNVLASIDSRGLTNGTYTFRLRTFDYAGNVGMTQWVAQVDNIVISNPDAVPMFFDPGTRSSAITLGLSRASDVTVRICPVTVTADGAGNLSVNVTDTAVRTMTQHLSAGSSSIAWNGRDDSGTVVSNSSYVFKIFAQSDWGRTNGYAPAYVGGPVTISNKSASTNFNFQGNDPIALSYSLYAPAYVGLGLASPVSGNLLAGVPRDAGTNVEYWNGRVPSSHQIIYGAFQANLLAIVMPENAIVVNHPPAFSGNLTPESFVVAPLNSEVSVIYYTLQRQADVTLWLRDPNGNRISLLQQPGQPAGNYTFEWNGRFDATALAATEGDYEVHLDTTDSTSGETQSAIGNLTVRK